MKEENPSGRGVPLHRGLWPILSLKVRSPWSGALCTSEIWPWINVSDRERKTYIGNEERALATNPNRVRLDFGGLFFISFGKKVHCFTPYVMVSRGLGVRCLFW